MSVSIILSDRRFKISGPSLSKLVKKVLRRESAFTRSINLVFCRDRDIIGLNREFKSKDNSTDVLAFDLSDSDNANFLGEIYINLQMARRQAVENRIPYNEEVKRLTIHGVLHL
jgi:probable rRNA maturation factor